MVKNSKVELSLDELVQALYKSGTTNAKEMHNKVSRFHKISLRTIQRKLNNLRKGKDISDKKERNRESKLWSQKRLKKLENLMEDEQGSLRNVKQKLPFEVSDSQQRKKVKDIGYTYQKFQYTNFIPKKNEQKRVDFSKKYSKKSYEDLFFCDETTFWLYEKPVGKWTTQNKKIPFPKPKYPFKIHDSAGICFNGKTSIHKFQENMSSQKYLEILQKTLVPGAQRLYKRKRFLFVQDGGRKHTAKICTDFLKQKRINYVKDWPGYSPDLNPIENIWVLLKKRIREKYPKNKEGLIRFIKSEWNEIPLNVVQNCIKNYPQRIQQVIDDYGQNTKN